MQRINVVGTSGSGKTTLSRRLARKLGYLHIEIDSIFWGPNWSMLPDGELYSRLEQELAGHRWVLDGNYNRTVPIKWARADTIVWLDLSFPRTVSRALRRAATRAFTRQELWPGTGKYETFRRSFLSRESVVLWTIQTHFKNRHNYAALAESPQWGHLEFIRLRTKQQVDDFLDRV